MTIKDIPPNTPIVIGLGFYQERKDDPLDSLEPYELMVKAVRNAADDAGSPKLLKLLDSISVQQGMWEYSNPAKLIADDIGCSSARSILADLGVLQLTPLFDLCNAIAAGEQQLGVVTGGEAKYRDLRGKITGQEVTNISQPEDTPAPDIHHKTPDPFASQLEADAGIFMPVELFAMMESALRQHQGLGIEEQRDKVAELYSDFSKIAAENPHAWNREVMSPEEIRNPVGKNAMLAFPYTKRHNSQWNVNQAVAIMVCSAAKAIELGLDDSNWIYPVSAVQSRHVVCLAQQQRLYSHPGTIMAGQRALALAQATTDDIDKADLYSCFPAAVQSFALDLNLEGVCPWSVTGSMAFAGGPYNHAGLDGAARMAEVLREQEDQQLGLVSNLSGIFGKQGIMIYSNQPAKNGFHFEDISDQVAKVDIPLPLDGDYTGPATVVAYTVIFNKETMSHAFAICDTPAGARTVVKSFDSVLLAQLTEQEFVGRTVEILPERLFALPA